MKQEPLIIMVMMLAMTASHLTSEQSKYYWCPDGTESPKKCVYLCPNKDGAGFTNVNNGTAPCSQDVHPFRRCDAVCQGYSEFYYSYYNIQPSNDDMDTYYPETFWCPDGTASTKKCKHLCPNDNGEGLTSVKNGAAQCSLGAYPFSRCDSVCKDNSAFYYSFYEIYNENPNIFWCPDGTESTKKCAYLCPNTDGTGLMNVKNGTKPCKNGGTPFRRCDAVCQDYSDFYYSYYHNQLSDDTSINIYYPETFWCPDGTASTKKCVYFCPNDNDKGLRSVKDGSAPCITGIYPFRRCDSVCQDNSGFYYSFYEIESENQNIFWCPDGTESPKKCVFLCPTEDGTGLMKVESDSKPCRYGGHPFRRCDAVCQDYSGFYYSHYQSQHSNDTSMNIYYPETYWCPDGRAATKKCVYLCPNDNDKGLTSVKDGSVPCSDGIYPFRRCDSVCHDNSGFYYSFYEIYSENPHIFWCPDGTEAPKKCVFLCPNKDETGLINTKNGNRPCNQGSYPFRRCDAVCQDNSDFYSSFYQNQLSNSNGPSYDKYYPETYWCPDGTASSKQCKHFCPNDNGDGLTGVKNGTAQCSLGGYPFSRCDSVCQDRSSYFYSFYKV